MTAFNLQRHTIAPSLVRLYLNLVRPFCLKMSLANLSLSREMKLFLLRL